MENRIKRLCGGYYRSFTQFKQQVEKLEDSRNFLQECAQFLQESASAGDDEKKVRFTRLFLKLTGYS